jgi:hypothetical protein
MQVDLFIASPEKNPLPPDLEMLLHATDEGRAGQFLAYLYHVSARHFEVAPHRANVMERTAGPVPTALRKRRHARPHHPGNGRVRQQARMVTVPSDLYARRGGVTCKVRSRQIHGIILGLAMALGLTSTQVEAQGTSNSRPSQVTMTLFSTLDEVDKAPSFPLARAAAILKVKLRPASLQTNPYMTVYEGHGGLWRRVELRLPNGKDASRFILVLEPATPIPMGHVMNHYGDVLALDPGNPGAGDQAMMGYTYKVKHGTIRFAFRDMAADYVARTILFDRM